MPWGLAIRVLTDPRRRRLVQGLEHYLVARAGRTTSSPCGWSHGDTVLNPPPGFTSLATTDNCPVESGLPLLGICYGIRPPGYVVGAPWWACPVVSQGAVTLPRGATRPGGKTIGAEFIEVFEVWQAFAVLLPARTVGVMGNFRTYARLIAPSI
jgi:hypothetical protein